MLQSGAARWLLVGVSTNVFVTGGSKPWRRPDAAGESHVPGESSSSCWTSRLGPQVRSYRVCTGLGSLVTMQTALFTAVVPLA